MDAVFWIGAGGKTGGLLSRLAGSRSSTSGTQITRDESDDDRKGRWGGGCFVLGLWSVDVLSQR